MNNGSVAASTDQRPHQLVNSRTPVGIPKALPKRDMRLEASALRYLDREDFRILSAVIIMIP